jgi:hypothetical protein
LSGSKNCSWSSFERPFIDGFSASISSSLIMTGCPNFELQSLKSAIVR